MSNQTKPIWHLRVVSSNISHAAYNVEKSKLKIDFHGDRSYVYYGVSVSEFMDFTLAESQGSFLSRNIKPVKDYKKIS